MRDRPISTANCAASAPDGITSFSRIQAASDAGNAAGRVFFLFDLLHLDGEALAARPLTERKERLAALLPADGLPLCYSDHVIGQGPAFYAEACAMHVEGIRLETRRRALHARQSWPVAQSQIPQPRGICRPGDEEPRRPEANAVVAPARSSESWFKTEPRRHPGL